jgi:hypothetical protein
MTEEEELILTTEDRQIGGFGKRPVKRLIKVCIGKLAGKMINPIDGRVGEYVLEGDPNNPNTALDDITIEFYTEDQWRFFKKHNKKFLEDGSLMEYEGEEPKLDTKNVLTDEAIDDALGKPFLALRSLLNKVDSPVTVRRILNRALSIEDMSQKYVEAIKERLVALENKELPSKMPQRLDIEL